MYAVLGVFRSHSSFPWETIHSSVCGRGLLCRLSFKPSKQSPDFELTITLVEESLI